MQPRNSAVAYCWSLTINYRHACFVSLLLCVRTHNNTSASYSMIHLLLWAGGNRNQVGSGPLSSWSAVLELRFVDIGWLQLVLIFYDTTAVRFYFYMKWGLWVFLGMVQLKATQSVKWVSKSLMIICWVVLSDLVYNIGTCLNCFQISSIALATDF